jgi:hypothetical protein
MPFRKQYLANIGLTADPYPINPEKRIQQIHGTSRKKISRPVANKIWDPNLKDIYGKKISLPTSQPAFDDFIVDTALKIYGSLPVSKGKTFGVAQKVINLFLKDLWALGLIPPKTEPFLHIPIDRGVLDKLKKVPLTWKAWTKAHATNSSCLAVSEYLDIQKTYRDFLANPAAPGMHPPIFKTVIELDQFLWHRI